MRIYLVGSLKDPNYPHTAVCLRDYGFDVVDDWRGSGPDGDARWRNYELFDRDNGYIRALQNPFALNAYEFDMRMLGTCEAAVAVCKRNRLIGASATAELSYAKWVMRIPTVIILNGEPEDWDLMLPLAVDKFAAHVGEAANYLLNYGATE